MLCSEAVSKASPRVTPTLPLKIVHLLPEVLLALMVLLAGVNVPIFLILWGLAPRTRISNDHGVLLTSTGVVTRFLGQQ